MALCESAVTLVWVDAFVGSLARENWSRLRDAMDRRPSGVVESGHWLSDPWLSRSSVPLSPVGLQAVWAPPHELDAWPSRGAREITSACGMWARTNHAAFAQVIATGGHADPADGTAAAETVTALLAAGNAGDAAARACVQQVLAWLDLAVGRPFRYLPLSSGPDFESLAREFLRRIVVALGFRYAGAFNERRLEALYNLEFARDGAVDMPWTRVGQGEGWREAWRALSTDLDAETFGDAIRLTARAMRCPPLLGGLVGLLEHGDGDARQIAVCMVRRWMLALRAMAWLEIALTAPREDVRPCDLACFAYNAVKPDFPRRTLAISHRSADVKATLIEMDIWGAARVAIDATNVPAWETNTGLVWGLFASTPAVLRVASAGYDASLWCRRERELTQYLLERCDFMSERWIGDVSLAGLRALDGAAIGSGTREFPPMTDLWTVDPAPRWELRMLRVAGLLRMLNAVLRDPGKRTNWPPGSLRASSPTGRCQPIIRAAGLRTARSCAHSTPNSASTRSRSAYPRITRRPTPTPHGPSGCLP